MSYGTRGIPQSRRTSGRVGLILLASGCVLAVVGGLTAAGPQAGDPKREGLAFGDPYATQPATAPAGDEPAAGAEIVSPADAAIMVYVPAGEFVMGIDPTDADKIAKDLGYTKVDDLWAWEAYPSHKVNLPGYFIDKYEVTVEQWQKFVQAAGQGSPPRSPAAAGSSTSKYRETTQHFDKPAEQALPAGEIRWDEAKKYAAWAGKSLPTEAQWEKAARGSDGRLYPWGNDGPTHQHGHFGKKRGESGQMPLLYTWVGRYPEGASPYGCMDMLGNQYEWTGEMLVPYPGNPQVDKMKEYAGTFACLRGGSWYHGWVGYYAAKRFGFKPDETYYHVGLRTVWTPPKGYFQSEDFKKAREAVKQRKAQLAEMVEKAQQAEKAAEKKS